MDLCVAVACVLLSCITPEQAFHLPRTYVHPYRTGAELEVGENIGDQIENSPYQFQMKTDQDDVKVCVANPLTEGDVEHFRQRIDDNYKVNLMLDHLPVSRLKNSDT